MKILLTLFVLLFSCSVVADDIYDFEIEGVSVGDSLLDHLSKEEIINQIESNKPTYNYLTDEFGEVYIFKNFGNYDKLSFFVKPNDKNYTIYSIRGMIEYDDNIEKCYAKQNEILEEISSIVKKTKISEFDFIFPWDPTGKSHIFHKKLNFNSGNLISVSCSEYEKSLKIKNNWVDGLSVSIVRKQVRDWLNKNIN